MGIANTTQTLFNSAPTGVDRDALLRVLGPTVTSVQAIQSIPRGISSFSGGKRLRENSQYVTGASGISTTHFKVEAEAPFSAVRIWVGDKSTSSPPTYAALVGATETGLMDTVANAFTPVYGGVSYNELSSSSIPAGFRAVTWNGASSITLPVNTYYDPNNYANFAVSDWISCKALPRTDVIDGRPMVVFRVAQTGSTSNFTQGNSTMSGWTAANGGNRLIASNNTSTNDVATVSNLPSAVGAGVLSYEKYAWVEFLYDVPSRNVVVIGDSREAAAYSAGGASWVTPTLVALSAQGAPIDVVNTAGSGHAYWEWQLLLTNMTSVGFSPTDVVLPGFSQNGFQQNHAGAESMSGSLIKLINSMRATGVKFWMTTDYGLGYTGAAESARQECIAKVKYWAQMGLVNLIDTDALLTDYTTTPGTPTLKAIYDAGDHIHANAAGQLMMGNLLASIWK